MEPITIGILTGIVGSFVGGYLLVQVAKGTPWAVRKVGRKLLGSTLLILGPSFSGKTSLIWYMQHGYYQDPDRPEDEDVFPIDEDDRTTDEETFTDFHVETDPNHGFNVANVTDIPGLLSVEDQVKIALRKNPEVILCIVSVKSSEKNEWISRFCATLNSNLLCRNDLKRKLRSLTFIVNKVDAMGLKNINDVIKDIRKIAHNKLKPSVKLNISRIQVVQLTLFKKHNAKKIAGAALKKIYDSIQNKEPLAK